MSSQYPRDEFDEVTDQGPVGVHRQPRSPWQTVLPFLLVLVMVPLLAWGATALIKGRGHEVPSSAGDTTQSQAAAQSETAGPASGGDSATPIPPAEEEGPTAAPDDPNNPGTQTESTEPGSTTEAPAVDAAVDYNAVIAVYNASGIEGLAGSNVSRLTEQGFTGVWAGNLESTGQTENTVFYTDAGLHPTAAKVAEVLGITNIVENAEATGGQGLAVVLLSQN